MSVMFSNNASTTINGAITASATSIVVADASELPSLGAGDYSYLTLANVTETKIEIVKVTSVNTGTKTLTVVRGQDGTSGLAFDNGDICELRVTAAGLNDVSSQDDDPAGSAVAMAIALG